MCLSTICLFKDLIFIFQLFLDKSYFVTSFKIWELFFNTVTENYKWPDCSKILDKKLNIDCPPGTLGAE